MIRYAVRRGLIGSDEGDRVTAEVEGAAAVKAEKAATRKAAREERKRVAGRPARSHGSSADKAGPARKHPAAKKATRQPAGRVKRAAHAKRSAASKRRH